MTPTRWLILAVALVPLAALPGEAGLPIAQVKNAALVLLGLGLIVWEFPSRWLQALAGWALVSVTLAKGRDWAVVGLLGILAFLLVHRAASRLSDAQWSMVVKAIACAAGFQVAWMVLQATGHDPLFRPLEYLTGRVGAGPVPVVGWFANPMDTALFLGLALFVLPLVLGVVVATAIVAGLGSTAGLVCVAFAGAWQAWLRTRVLPRWWLRWAIPAFAAVFLLGVLLWEQGAALAFVGMPRDYAGFGGRVPVWHALWNLSTVRPIAGWGPNAIGSRLTIHNATTNDRWDFGFNEYLQGAVDVGWVGVILALGYLASLLWRGRAKWATEPLTPFVAALLVLGLFSIPLRVGPAALLCALFLGRLEGRVSA